MKYQFVLQWPASSIKDYDALIEIEDTLVKNLGKGSEVDGHDAGSGEMNIFIHTDDPVATFTKIKLCLVAATFGSTHELRIVILQKRNIPHFGQKICKSFVSHNHYMSFMFEVYYKEPVDESKEQNIKQVVENYGGSITYREEPMADDTSRAIILTCEFQDLTKAEEASKQLREAGEHVEAIQTYGDD